MLEKIGAFQGMHQSLLQQLEAVATPLEPPSGTRLFMQGDPADAAYAMASGTGHVRVGVMDRRSKSLMVQIFRTGDRFGEIGVIEQHSRTAEAAIQGRVLLLRIPGQTFRELLQSATFDPLEMRLASQLIYLADLSGRRGEDGIRLDGRYRHADLADLLGATPRSIITILNGWRAKGHVHYDGQKGTIILQNEQALRDLAEI